MACEICSSNGGTIHRVREMMFATGDEFEYRECRTCGCLSLVDPPADMAKYYPNGYYSMVPGSAGALRRLRNRVYLSPLSFLVNWHGRSDLDAMNRCKLRKGLRLLDVGCGAGHLIGDLRELGYDAVGVDPFVTQDVPDQFGVRVFRKRLDEVTGSYDVVLFRHSLEHMPRQLDTLRAARRRLASGGVCVVCIPVLGWAWRHYGPHWCQLDAPRHFFLHTVQSLGKLAEEAGFKVQQVVYDSDEFQFWGSELYRQNRPLNGCTPPGWMETMQLRRRAGALNRSHDGDKAQFYLTTV